jgi:hypothetical protein
MLLNQSPKYTQYLCLSYLPAHLFGESSRKVTNYSTENRISLAPSSCSIASARVKGNAGEVNEMTRQFQGNRNMDNVELVMT